MRRVFLRMGVKVRSVKVEQLGERVGFLAGLDGYGPAEEPALPESGPEDPVMVFCDITGSRLDMLLQALRRAGVPRSAYKAMITVTNATWTFSALAEELARERSAIARGQGEHASR